MTRSASDACNSDQHPRDASNDPTQRRATLRQTVNRSPSLPYLSSSRIHLTSTGATHTLDPYTTLEQPDAIFVSPRSSAESMLRREASSDALPDSDSLSGLSSLDNASDSFEQKMANALRDQQRLRNATVGPAQAFGKRRRDKSLKTAMEEVSRLDLDAPTPAPQRPVQDANNHAAHAPRAWGSKARTETGYLAEAAEAAPRTTYATLQMGNGRSSLRAAKPSTLPTKVTTVEDVLRLERDEAELVGQDSPESLRPPRRQTYDAQDRIKAFHSLDSRTKSMRAAEPRRLPSLRDTLQHVNAAPSNPSVDDTAARPELAAKPAKRDSRLLLKQLARAASATPSPPPKPRAEPEAAAPTAVSANLQDEARPDVVRPANQAVPAYVPRRRRSGEKRHARITDDAAARNHESEETGHEVASKALYQPQLAPAPAPATEKPGPAMAQPNSDLAKQKQTQSDRLASVQHTPKVTGSWIETPAVARQTQVEAKPIKRESSHETSTGEKQPHVRHPRPQTTATKTTSQRVALDQILEEFKASGEELDPESSNILRDMADQEIDVSEIAQVNESSLEGLEKVESASSRAEKERQKELLALQEMARRLQAARSGLRDVKKNMKRVESEIETQEARERLEREVQKQLKAEGQLLAAKSHSAASRHDIRLWTLVQNEFAAAKMALFTWPRDGRVRLTWLGLVLAAILAWWLTEVTLCGYYCHPLYAYTMVGYGVDPYAPKMPWVTLTLAARPFRFLWGPPFDFIVRCLVAVLRPVDEFLFWLLRDDKLYRALETYRNAPTAKLTDVLSRTAVATASATTSVHRPFGTFGRDGAL